MTVDLEGKRACVWGWNYRTLQGHVEMGEMCAQRGEQPGDGVAVGHIGHLGQDGAAAGFAPDLLGGTVEVAGLASHEDEVRAPDVPGRAAEAAAVLGELGGMAEVEAAEGALVIRGFDCPLGEVVEGHPPACRLAEALLAELIGAPVAERCRHGRPPRCAFEVTLPPKDRS